MLKSQCSRSYHDKAADVIDVFAIGVKTGVYTHNPPFVAPPMTEPQFDAFIQTYMTKRSDYVQGGLAQKGAFQAAKAALLDALDQFAEYVDEIADGDANVITDAGFVPTDVTKTPAVKPGQSVVSVKRGIGGELFASCAKVTGVTYYGCIMVAGQPLPEGAYLTPEGKLIFEAIAGPMPGLVFDLTRQREKQFSGLTHDVTYYFYFYLVNTAGVGPLSEVVSIICW
jgi:hypothetical protein